MDNRFRLILSSKNFYKEIELTSDMQALSVGTALDCDIRLHKEWFFEPLQLNFLKKNDVWNVTCSDNIYISVGDVRKLMNRKLEHGDIFGIRYQQSENEAFSLEFIIDFGSENIKYERSIDISGSNNIVIGCSVNSNIVINDEYTKDDEVVLITKNGRYALLTQKSSYGVYHNGKRAADKQEIFNGDFFSISDYFFYLKDGKLWTEIRTMGINGLKYEDCPEPENYPKFNRNTRIKNVVSDEEIEILDPPNEPKKPKSNLIMRLMPSLGMMIASGLMMYLSSRNGNSGGMMVFSLITGGMAVVTAIMGVIEGKKDYKKEVAERISKYTAYIDNKENEITELRKIEGETLEKIYISNKDEQEYFSEFSSHLFDRTSQDEDFLSIRLGNGEVEAKRTIKYKKQEKLEVGDELQQKPEELANKYKMLENAPVVCNLKEINALGIVGVEEYRFELFKDIVIDLAARQYHSDVNMMFVASSQNRERISWLRFLPHAYSDRLNSRTIVTDDESKTMLFEYLFKVLTMREEQKTYEENIVVFLYDDLGFRSHPLSRFVEKAKDLGVTFIFFADAAKDLPIGCSYIVEIQDKEFAQIINTTDCSDAVDFRYPHIDDNAAQDIVTLLAPVYTEEISLESSLTKSYSMFQMLNILAVDDLNLEKRWASSHAEKSMAAPIGISKTGIVELDLHDKAHGPHGLVAGTTGSGKSEVLQTYILAMATLFHPYEVGFVIIDFKGGGMVNQFAELPHLMGAITNIDGKEIDRSLKSIKAELQKRQRYFAEADVNHIDKYIKKYKSGEVSEPLPHLIIIVDEFAELKAEQPEFMKELISAARIGRSLGVHLILATQKPAGQVNEQIWSNSRFKLCLKVQSKEDSNEMLKSPLAAEIKEPGRAYLQVGNNEIFELFQSAYSGESEKIDDSNTKEFTLYSITETGKRNPVYQQKKQKKGEGSATQLDAIVRYVSSYCDSKGLKKLPDICLPSLEHIIPFPNSDKLKAKNNSIEVELGIFDDPDNQYQGEYAVNLTESNMMIIGSAQSGKTNVLQNIIRSISTKYRTDEVTIYIIDFASMILKNYESLNHVGGVVTASEDEKLKNLMKLLFAEIETRKEKLISVGVSSFAAYKEAGKTDLPQIVLMIDNLTALKEIYYQDDDELISLCREGLSVGISIIIANAQTSGIGYKYLSNFPCRMAMFCNDSSEYGALFDHCRETLDDIHGRCIIEIDKEHLEGQTYLAFEGEKEIDRAKAIREYIAECNMKNPRNETIAIPEIPELLTTSFVKDRFRSLMTEKGKLVAGLDYDTVTPFVLDFDSMGLLAITGRERMGRHNFFKYAISMYDYMHPGSSEVYIIDGIKKRLSGLKDRENVKSYDFMPDTAVDVVKDIESVLKQRYENLMLGNVTANENSFILLIINSRDALETISNDFSAFEAFKNIIGKYKSMNVCVLIGDYENTNISYSSPEIIRTIRDNKQFLLFEDMSNMKILDMPLAVMRKFKKPINVGDAFYIKDNDCVKLKTPMES